VVRADPIARPTGNGVVAPGVPNPAAAAFIRDRNGARRPYSGGRSARSVAQRCEDHIEALYARAYLQLGDRTAAQDAVIAAVARAAGLPSTPHGVTVSVWHVLAAHLQAHSFRPPDDRGVADPGDTDGAEAQPIRLIRQRTAIPSPTKAEHATRAPLTGPAVGPNRPGWRRASSSATVDDLQEG
jgi:hypothetical protein